KVEEYTVGGKKRFHWAPAEVVEAVAYDTPIPGFDTYNCLNIRLWSSRPPKEFDLDSFSRGDYYKAVEEKQQSENITHVLYPNDNTQVGKELRLKQQYFFVSASLQDILRRFKRSERAIDDLPLMAAIQLNDTHPTLGVPELMRLLVDEEGLEWDRAWHITTKVYAYTNHTVLPEALETWPVGMMEHLLPRQMRIIFDINAYFLSQVERRWPGDIDRLRRMSIIEEGYNRKVRMANLAIVASHAVNGVAAIHTEIIKTRVFPDFYQMWPHKFQNKTNGITPRRWIGQANPTLSATLTKWLKGDEWLVDLGRLRELLPRADDEQLQAEFAHAKLVNKRRLTQWVVDNVGVEGINPE
ncbi:MAG: glycogen/starch/alpha-glucan phosphorylase, partial [Myxococcales bacterium]|nr:glycogen/starch/alpha-glucan phosphorylase [Myxococcales bacterium]